ncbi:hypothetical protein E4U61_000116 [Claviceps capensis]|nr:hypothetical protein E4U61_000116 [Claviceps capensis]
MKFFSPFIFFFFGALVTPIIGHAVPNVEGGVDVVERDVAGAPAHLFARKKVSHSLTPALHPLPLPSFFSESLVLEHVTRMAATALTPSAYVVAPTSAMPANALRVVRWSNGTRKMGGKPEPTKCSLQAA